MSREKRRCGSCGEPVGPRAENDAYPFCRDRCRQIDLGRWLDAEYVVSTPLIPGLYSPPPTDDD